MTSFEITEMRNFMGKLLAGDCFDSFVLEEAVIRTAVEFSIDGHLNKEFYSKEEQETQSLGEFASWQSMRPLCYDMIRGRNTPLAFKIVLHLDPAYLHGVLKGADETLRPEQVRALVLRIAYDGEKINLVTGVAFHSFVMDKTLDAQWDKTMRRFLQKKEIAFAER